MKEELISFETAKLLKQKNIILDYFYHYDEYGTLNENSVIYIDRVCTHNLYANNTDFEMNRWGGGSTKSICTTSQSLLQRWLRKEHNIHIMLDVSDLSRKWFFVLSNIKEMMVLDSVTSNYHDNYEDALEQGLLESLKLI